MHGVSQMFCNFVARKSTIYEQKDLEPLDKGRLSLGDEGDAYMSVASLKNAVIKTTMKKEKTERKPNWKEYTATVEDIQNFIMDRLMLRHNVITRRVEYRLPSSYEHEGTDWLPISDRVVNSLWSELSAEKVVRAQDIYRVLESDFVPEFNPFQFYLDQLPPWDGGDYILAMSVSVSVKGEVEEQLRFAQYLKKWLVGMVAGWIDPAVVNNVILVLIGEQGSYKTTWFNYILPPPLRPYFYTKTNAGKMGRDDLLTLAQYGLVCCEELDTMRPSELNQLKAAVTMPSIDERAAYAHFRTPKTYRVVLWHRQ